MERKEEIARKIVAHYVGADGPENMVITLDHVEVIAQRIVVAIGTTVVVEPGEEVTFVKLVAEVARKGRVERMERWLADFEQAPNQLQPG